jgi:vancomycin resistance protein YoaR
MTDDTTHREPPREDVLRSDATLSFEAVGAGIEPVPGTDHAAARVDRWNGSTAGGAPVTGEAAEAQGESRAFWSQAAFDKAAPWRDDDAAYVSRRAHRTAARGGGFTSGRGEWFRRLSLPAKLGVVVPSALIALLLVVGVADAAATSGRIQYGVKVDGVAVGGLAPAEATARISAQVGPRLDRTVTATAAGHTWPVAATTIDASLDASQAAQAAYGLGRSGGFFRQVGDRLAAVTGALAVPVTISMNEDKLAVFFATVDSAVAVPGRDASITVEGTKLALVPAKTGTGLLIEQVRTALKDAFLGSDPIADLKVDTVPVNVTDADAAAALADARKLVSGPVSLTWQSQAWSVSAEQLAGWLTFQKVPISASEASAAAAIAAGADVTPKPGERMRLVAGFDPDLVSATVFPLTKSVTKPAIDAQFITNGDHITIKPGQVGLGPDAKSLAVDLANALKGTGPRSVGLKMTQLLPTVTTERAQTMGITARISTFTTTYSASATQRVNNIRTLATALDGKLVAPGETFSFNGAIGERTAAKGYQEAPAIVNGQLVPQLGGGICQVGTTFFNVVFFSGLPVVERQNHSFYISHYPKGRDCTVSWGGPDFKWTNTTSSWILIRTSASNSSLTISLYGTNPGYQVTYTTSDFTNVVPFTVKQVPDPTLPAGAQIIDDPGVNGCRITVVRTVSLNGSVVRTDTFVSIYKAKVQSVRVGTKASAATTGTPKP